MNENQLERAIIGALASVSAVDPAEARKLLDALKLDADDFADVACADVFRAAVDFLGRGVPLELFALETALAASQSVRKAGGRGWLAPLLMDPPTSQTAVHEHARVVRDRSTRRRAIQAMRRVAERIKQDTSDLSDALSEGAQLWQALVNRAPHLATSEGDVFRLGEMLDAAQAGRRELCVPTGIRALDENIGGLLAGRLTLVGALPGVGKSALLATVMRNVANRGTRVGFFSLEDERMWLSQRLLALESKVPLFLLCTKPLTKTQRERVEEAASGVYRTLSNVLIDDRPALSPAEVAQTARDMVLNHGVRLLVVDHLGEMKLNRSSDRHDLEVADALACLRDVAKRHDVPVLVASHVRRRQGLGIENEPSLTDFANSSAPERMARLAIGLSKPSPDVLRATILKQTNGPAGQQVDLQLIPSAAMVDSNAYGHVPEADHA